LVTNAFPGKIVALDLGEAYSGVAISDTGGFLARPLEVIPSDRLVEYLGTLLAEEGIAEVVVGVPKTLGGELGFQAKRVLTILSTLRDAFPTVRFVEWDERLTTRLTRSLRSEPRSAPRKRGTKERVDHLAAAAMLQEYLDRRETFEAVRRGP
jgi:putative holliday junction resolvase